MNLVKPSWIPYQAVRLANQAQMYGNGNYDTTVAFAIGSIDDAALDVLTLGER